MTKKLSNKQFKKIFDHIAKNYDNIINPYALYRRKKFFIRYAKGKCLEVGAGSGEISKALLKKHTIIATDISTEMVEIIKNKLKIQAVVCDAEKLPFKNSSFDTVIASELIYYLEHPRSLIKESKRVLKKNGRLLISSASKMTQFYDQLRSILRKLGISSMYFDDPNKKFMSKLEIIDLLKSEGFAIKKIEITILFPFKRFDSINNLIEKTPLKFFCSFIYVFAEKIY